MQQTRNESDLEKLSNEESSNIGKNEVNELLSDTTAALTVSELDFYYGKTKALNGINMLIPERKVTAFIGPSGCGKSTLLRIFNRMNDLIENTRVEGSVRLKGQEIFSPTINVSELRQRVGMVFQKPNPFPKSIYENVAYGLRIQGINNKAILNVTIEEALRGAALWDEVKDRLHENALSLSGGQQQRVNSRWQ